MHKMEDSIKLPRGLHRKLGELTGTKSRVVDICQICQQNNFKYTCPRCNMKYCSTKCFKSESHISCSEMFYKDCCLQRLGEVETDDQTDKIKVLEYLKKDFEERSSKQSDLDPDELAERIGSLDLDSASDLEVIWERLTPAEKAKFQSSLVNGEAASWLVHTDPWWQTSLVVDTKDSDSCPSLFPKMKPLSSMTKAKPSPAIANNLVNVLFSYVYLWRLYKGDLQNPEIAMDIFQDFLSLSSVLSTAASFNSVSTSLCDAVIKLGSSNALNAASEQGISGVLFCSNQFTQQAFTDVSILCSRGEETVLRALSDARCFCVSAKKILNNSTEKDQNNLNGLDLKKVVGVIKKLEYYIGWTLEYAEMYLHDLAVNCNREALAYQKKIESVQSEAELINREKPNWL